MRIEKNIALPPHADAHRKYRFDWLEIGESTLFESPNYGSLRVSVCKAGKKFGRTFRTRKVKGGIRVWRVA